MYWHLSLAIAIFEFLALFYVFHRDQYLDYYFGLFFIPFAVQQFCQCLIFALDVNTELNNCGILNQVYSNVILIFIYFIPVFVCFTALRTNMMDCSNTFWKMLFLIELVLYMVFTTTTLLDDYNCAYIGDHGHLSLKYVFYSKYLGILLFDEVLEILLLFYYFTPFIMSFILYQPLWIVFIPYSYLLTMFIVLRLVLKYESYSVWCLSSVMVCIWMIIHVPITKYFIRKKYFRVIDGYDDSKIGKVFLTRSYSQLVSLDMVHGGEIQDTDEYTANEQEREPFEL